MNPLKIFTTPEYLFNPRQIFVRLRRSIVKPTMEKSVVRLPWGDEITIRPDECIGCAIWYYGIFDLIVAEALARLVDEGDCVLDVGSNIGQMTSLLRRLVGPTGRVDAFEPHPDLFDELMANYDSWGCHDRESIVNLHQIGLSDVNGRAQMILPESWDTNRGIGRINDLSETDERKIEIDIRTLAKMIPEGQNIGMCKIDIEGHEYKAFMGAEALLKNHQIRDIVFEELNPFPTEVHLLLKSHGYKIFALWTSALRPVLSELKEDFITPTTRDGMNYLATIDPNRARKRFAGLGWKVMSL